MRKATDCVKKAVNAKKQYDQSTNLLVYKTGHPIKTNENKCPKTNKYIAQRKFNE